MVLPTGEYERRRRRHHIPAAPTVSQVEFNRAPRKDLTNHRPPFNAVSAVGAVWAQAGKRSHVAACAFCSPWCACGRAPVFAAGMV